MLEGLNETRESPTRRKGNVIAVRVDDDMWQQWQDTKLALMVELGSPDLTQQEVMMTVVELCIRPNPETVGLLAGRIRERRTRLVDAITQREGATD